MPDPIPSAVTTQELRIVDAAGVTRMVLSAANGLPSITLRNPDPSGPSAAFELDAKGGHLKLDRPGGASAYLFLNNAGASGVVLIDADGKTRASVVLSADGSLSLQHPPGDLTP